MISSSRLREKKPVTYRQVFEKANIYVDRAVDLHFKPKEFKEGHEIPVVEVDLSGADAAEAERLRKLYVGRMITSSKRNLVSKGVFDRRLLQDAAERASLQDWKKPVVMREMIEFIGQTRGSPKNKERKKEG